MAERYNFRPRCDDEELGCFAPPIDFGCEDTCPPCDNPCEQKCPPKVRVQDAVCLSDEEYERCFSLHQYVGCAPMQIPAQIYCIALKVRRRGLCRVLTEECPTRADRDGNACFVWSDKFRSLPEGYYEADLYINDKSCYTWLFRKRGCWATLTTQSVQLDHTPCDPPCGCCIGCVPTPDVETDDRLGDCGECNGNQCE